MIKYGGSGWKRIKLNIPLAIAAIVPVAQVDVEWKGLRGGGLMLS